MPAIKDQRDVDVDDVALFERLLARDAVTDDVIDGRASRFLIAAVHERRRQRVMIEGIIQH